MRGNVIFHVLKFSPFPSACCLQSRGCGGCSVFRCGCEERATSERILNSSSSSAVSHARHCLISQSHIAGDAY